MPQAEAHRFILWSCIAVKAFFWPQLAFSAESRIRMRPHGFDSHSSHKQGLCVAREFVVRELTTNRWGIARNPNGPSLALKADRGKTNALTLSLWLRILYDLILVLIQNYRKLLGAKQKFDCQKWSSWFLRLWVVLMQRGCVRKGAELLNDRFEAQKTMQSARAVNYGTVCAVCASWVVPRGVQFWDSWYVLSCKAFSLSFSSRTRAAAFS